MALLPEAHGLLESVVFKDASGEAQLKIQRCLWRTGLSLVAWLPREEPVSGRVGMGEEETVIPRMPLYMLGLDVWPLLLL